ncbi:MAG TPA: glycoside hydrolase family 47 protein [Chitinophagales bacterium]|nr:glycoside hydrolase family 47 protein [Chitinophagales bacterium]
MKRHFLPAIFFILFCSIGHAQTFTAQQKNEMCDSIKAALQFAWNGYKKYAWGADEVTPITKEPQNWYLQSLLMTPMDAFDTFILLGMNDEAKEAKRLIFSRLDFQFDQSVQVFEITIRLLAALQSAYELSGDKEFLKLAEDLGNRLMPAFNSPTGMPYRFVNLQTGKTSDSLSNPAEIGTLMLEFGKLSQLTGNTLYYTAAKRAAMEVFESRSKIGLLGSGIDVNTGEWMDSDSHISGGIDSYYEYLYKAWLLFGDEDFKYAWDIESAAIKKYLLRKENSGWYFAHVNMITGTETGSYYGALDAFFAGTLALSGDVATAEKVQEGNYYMWTHFKMEPEVFDFRQDTIVYPSYPLRPENLESCFYLYRFTHDDLYLQMGQRMVSDILTHCRAGAGYAAIKDVTTMEQEDDMESYFFAETLKYAYLLFAPEETIDLSKIVFNTEAHPLRIKQ